MKPNFPGELAGSELLHAEHSKFDKLTRNFEQNLTERLTALSTKEQLSQNTVVWCLEGVEELEGSVESLPL